MIGNSSLFALIGQNIWQYAPVFKLYRGVPLFRYLMILKSSYLKYSIMLKPSSRQVLATLAIQHGFCPIKYSQVIVYNSVMGKPSYWRDFKSLISMWSWTQWIENRVALLCSDGISNHLFACEAEPDEREIKLLSLLSSGIVELFCYLLPSSTDQLLMQFSSSFSDQLLLIFRIFC